MGLATSYTGEGDEKFKCLRPRYKIEGVVGKAAYVDPLRRIASHTLD